MKMNVAERTTAEYKLLDTREIIALFNAPHHIVLIGIINTAASQRVKIGQYEFGLVKVGLVGW